MTLRRFPVDTLKLHQWFVHEITQDQADATIVTAMISIGNRLNLRVIVEWIETRARLKFLQRHGCGEEQGDHLSFRAPADQAAKLVEGGFCEGAVGWYLRRMARARSPVPLGAPAFEVSTIGPASGARTQPQVVKSILVSPKIHFLRTRASANVS